MSLHGEDRGCFSEGELAELMGGVAGPEALAGLDAHIDRCRPCRELVVALARARSGPVAAVDDSKVTPNGSQVEPEVGETVGRFVIEGVRGAGAMGVVYTAYDPKLGRRVALKLVRPDRSSPASRARMLREAQAMARLAHPNVVVLYDAGTVAEQVFIAMELVDGTTLADWLRAAPRPWRARLEMFQQAGRGLAAAHAAGIVHRDFKPTNVLVGPDGRARVNDFGLARETDDGVPDDDRRPGALAGADATRPGTVLGTPAYMAPEQERGEQATELSDQYSFCVSLYEGLYGTRPSRGQPRGDGSKMPEPPRSAVPAAVRKAIARGLSAAPEQRHPTMAALLDALAAALRRRRSLAAAAVTVAVAAAAAGTALLISDRARAGDPCAGAEQRLIGVWDATRKQALHAAFAATGSPVAERQWQAVERTLDRYTSDWVARRGEVCAAAGPRHDLEDARLACLDQRLENLRSWVGVFERADVALVERAAESAAGCDDLQMCGDPAAALQPVPQDPDLRRRVLGLRGLLQAQKVRTQAGAHEGAFITLLGLQVAARALGYLPFECEVVDALGYNHQARDELEKAIPYFRRAGELAEEARYDLLRAHAWIGLAFVLDFLYRYDESENAASYAEAVLKPMSGRQVEGERLRVELVEALNLWGRGRRQEAAERLRLVTAALEKHHGRESFVVSTALFERATLLVELDRLDEAAAALRRAEAIVREVGGDTHPVLAKITGALGNIAYKRGDYATALAEQRRSLELKLRRAPPDSITVGIARANIGEALLGLRSPDEALVELAAARAIVVRAMGLKNDMLAEISASIGQAWLELHRPAEAVAPLEEALAAREATRPEPGKLGELRFQLARALWDAGRDRTRARALAEQARSDLKPVARVDEWLASHRPSR